VLSDSLCFFHPRVCVRDPTLRRPKPMKWQTFYSGSFTLPWGMLKKWIILWTIYSRGWNDGSRKLIVNILWNSVIARDLQKESTNFRIISAAHMRAAQVMRTLVCSFCKDRGMILFHNIFTMSFLEQSSRPRETILRPCPLFNFIPQQVWALFRQVHKHTPVRMCGCAYAIIFMRMQLFGGYVLVWPRGTYINNKQN
jgi:hypothetical protein